MHIGAARVLLGSFAAIDTADIVDIGFQALLCLQRLLFWTNVSRSGAGIEPFLCYPQVMELPQNFANS